MSKLNLAIEYVKAGDKSRAKQILTEVIQAEPGNDTAWLWMSSIVDTKEQQIRCLQQALQINPNNQHATIGLSKLTGQSMLPENPDQKCGT